jgi:hypothetical protein
MRTYFYAHKRPKLLVPTPKGTLTISALSTVTGVPESVLYHRFTHGITEYTELTKPVNSRSPRGKPKGVLRAIRLAEAAQSMREVAARKAEILLTEKEAS